MAAFSIALGVMIVAGSVLYLRRLISNILSSGDEAAYVCFMATVSSFIWFVFCGLTLFYCARAGWIHYPALLVSLTVSLTVTVAWLIRHGNEPESVVMDVK